MFPRNIIRASIRYNFASTRCMLRDSRERTSIYAAGERDQKEEAVREIERREATRRALIAVDEASSLAVVFVECPRCLSTTGVTCLGAKITRPWCLVFHLPPPSQRVLLSSLVAIAPPDPPSSSLSMDNPFPQTKGSRGPSTSIYLRRLERPPRGLVFRSGM